MRMANMSKTTNYASRMVISAPELKAETVDDMMVDFDHCHHVSLLLYTDSTFVLGCWYLPLKAI